MPLNVLVAKEAESNYLLKKFASDTKLRDIINTNKVEDHHKKTLFAQDTEILCLEYCVLFYSPMFKQNTPELE